jgi:hypothetical protein
MEAVDSSTNQPEERMSSLMSIWIFGASLTITAACFGQSFFRVEAILIIIAQQI